MKKAWLIGGVVVTGLGLLLWKLLRGGTSAKLPEGDTPLTKDPHPGYMVQPVYGLPTGCNFAEMQLGQVKPEDIALVKLVHKQFKLTRAIQTDYGTWTGYPIYLIEEHEGFDPLFFRIEAKE